MLRKEQGCNTLPKILSQRADFFFFAMRADSESQPSSHKFTADEIDHYWFKQRQEFRELQRLNASVPVRKLWKRTKILTAWNEYSSGQAIFESYGMGWRCVEAGKWLSWMKITPNTQLKVELLKRGMRWVWSNEFSDSAPPMSRGSDSAGEGTSNETADSNKGGTRPSGSAPPTSMFRGPLESPRCSGLARTQVVTA